MVEIDTLKYPKKSHRKIVLIPKQSSDLAEFFGIMIGDGGINNPWQANVSVNAIKDKEYSLFVSRLCKNLFDILPVIRKRKEREALVISITSVTLVDFLVKNGLPRGNKLKNGLRIPNWILSKKSYRVACVRGLVDTDGCIFIHKHTVRKKRYENINFCFTSYSPELINQVAAIFGEFNILAHIDASGNNLYLYKQDDVSRYLKIFKTSNSRIISVYNKWRDARVV